MATTTQHKARHGYAQTSTVRCAPILAAGSLLCGSKMSNLIEEAYRRRE
jgi:hypothetical protein